MILRWAVWGEVAQSQEMLQCSINSFRKYFGEEHTYVLATDQPQKVSEINGVRVIPFDNEDLFSVDSHTTWRKWAPNARLDITQDEIYVDADVFLVNYPTEIFNFLNNDKYNFAILGEHDPQEWQHGIMHSLAKPETPFVNAGLFIQKAGHSVASDLEYYYQWWKNNVDYRERQKHDEQGSLAISLTEAYKNKTLYVFPQEKYRLIGVPEVDSIDSLDSVELFHATYPSHPAFYKFRYLLD